jgi:hypothetical protein
MTGTAASPTRTPADPETIMAISTSNKIGADLFAVSDFYQTKTEGTKN